MTIINQITSFKISGFTYNGTDTQLNYTAGVTGGTAQPSKALVLDAGSNINSINTITLTNLNTTTLSVNGTTITSGTLTNLSCLDGAIVGTGVANKVLILDSNRDITNIRNLNATSITGTLQTAAQPNITSIGILSSLALSGALSGVTTIGASGIVSITNTTTSTNTTTGALVVTGGVGIGGAINIGGNLSVAGNIMGTLITSAQPNITSIGTLTSLSLSGAITGITNISAGGNLTLTGHNGLTTGLILNSTLVTATGTELNYLDLTNGPGTGEASKAIILDSNRDIINIRNLTATSLTATNLTGTIQTAAQTNITSVGTLTSLTLSGSLTGVTTFNASGVVSITNTTTATNATTGALVVSGGLGVTGAIYTNNVLVTNNGAIASTTTSGALRSGGGLGVTGSGFFGNTVAAGQTAQTGLTSWLTSGIQFRTGAVSHTTTSTGTLASAVFSSFAQPTLAAATAGTITTEASTVYIDNSPLAGTNMTITNGYALCVNSGRTFLKDGTTSTNTTSGALVITGGVGIGGSVNIGGALSVTGNITGTLITVSQPNITTLGGITSIGASNATTITGTLQTASQTNITSVGTLTSLSSNGNVNITQHNGSTVGLQLNGTLITATANELNVLDGITATTSELNYVDTTPGIAEASKSIVLNSNKDISEIRNLSIAKLALNNTTNYRTVIDCGLTSDDRIIGIYNDTASFYGFGAKDNLLKIQGGKTNGIAFYTSATNSSIGDQQMIISSTTVNILQTTSSSSTTTGALVISGGVGVSGGINIGSTIGASGIISFTNTTDSSSSITGALVVSGGVGIATNTNIGGALTVTGNITGTLATASQTNITSVGTLTGLTSSGVVSITNTTASTDSLSGSLVVSGGVGIAGAVNTGNTISTTQSIGDGFVHNAIGTNLITLKSYINTANTWAQFGTSSNHELRFMTNSISRLNISNSGAISTPSVVSITNTTTASNATSGALIVSGGLGVNGAIYTNNILVTNNGAIASNTSSGALRSSGGLGVTGSGFFGNIVAAGQTAQTGLTSWLTSGIQFRTGAVSHTTTSTGTLASAVFSSFAQPTLAAATAGTITTEASTVYIDNSPLAGANMSITNAYALWINSGRMILKDTTVSTSTTTGSLIVSGGVGINHINIGGNRTLASWGLTGPQFNATANTYTDSSTPTGNNSAQQAINSFQKSTLAATNANVVYTAPVANVYIANGPDAGTNTTINTKCALLTGGAIAINPGTLSLSNWTSALIHFKSGTSTTSINDTGSSNITTTIGTNEFNSVQYTSNTVGRTMTRAATIVITNAPTAGTNMTITNRHALYVTNGNTTLADSTTSTSTTTGALIVTGGVGIGGAVNIGGTLNIEAPISITPATKSIAGTSVNGVIWHSNQDRRFGMRQIDANNLALCWFGGGTYNDKIVFNEPSGTTINTAVNITNTTASTSSTTGALTVSGGVGIGGAVNAGTYIKTPYIQVGTSTDTSRLISCLDGITTVNSDRRITLGSSNSSGNQAEINFNYQGSNNNSNRLSLGFHSNTTLLNILNSGNVGIGTLNPEDALEVIGDIRATDSIYVSSTTGTRPKFIANWTASNYWGIGPHDASTGSTYRIRIGVVNNSDGWEGSYPAIYAGTYNNSSDYRLKNTIIPIENILSKLLQLNPVTYYLNQDAEKKEKQIGFLAHEVEQLFPEFVTGVKDDPNSTQSLNYAQMSAVLVKGIQEQQILITQFQNENKELKNKIMNLENTLTNILQRLSNLEN